MQKRASPYWACSTSEAGATLASLRGDWGQVDLKRVASLEMAEEAHAFLTSRYREVGYHASTPEENRERDWVALSAYLDGEVIGTITVGFDSGPGLLADLSYRVEVDSLRSAKRTPCEIIRLAVGKGSSSKRVLMALFHLAASVYGAKLKSCTNILAEVDPASANFYLRRLGFTRLGAEVAQGRAGGPIVLLNLDAVGHGTQKLQQFGGNPRMAKEERTMYPRLFSPEEERLVLSRIAALAQGVH